jgi:hypothetical protein
MAKQKGALGGVVRLEGNVVRSPYNRPPRAQRGSRGIALLILDFGARKGWMVRTTPQPLYPQERDGKLERK